MRNFFCKYYNIIRDQNYNNCKYKLQIIRDILQFQFYKIKDVYA